MKNENTVLQTPIPAPPNVPRSSTRLHQLRRRAGTPRPCVAPGPKAGALTTRKGAEGGAARAALDAERGHPAHQREPQHGDRASGGGRQRPGPHGARRAGTLRPVVSRIRHHRVMALVRGRLREDAIDEIIGPDTPAAELTGPSLRSDVGSSEPPGARPGCTASRCAPPTAPVTKVPTLVRRDVRRLRRTPVRRQRSRRPCLPSTSVRIPCRWAPPRALLNALPTSRSADAFPFYAPDRIRQGRLLHRCHAICTDAGIGRVHLDDLRHAVAGHAVMSGENLSLVGKLLGHHRPCPLGRRSPGGRGPARRPHRRSNGPRRIRQLTVPGTSNSLRTGPAALSSDIVWAALQPSLRLPPAARSARAPAVLSLRSSPSPRSDPCTAVSISPSKLRCAAF